jgi:hypothetical protein
MEFKVKKGKELDLDTRLTEFQKEIAASRFPWYYEWLRSMNTSFFGAHHPGDPIPAKLKMKILGDLTLLRARELREQFCYTHLEPFYLYEKPPITYVKLDGVITSLFHNRDYFQDLPEAEHNQWEKIRKMAVDAENLLRSALNPNLEIQDYALRYGPMNSSLALYLWTRRELEIGNLEEVRKQHEGPIEKKLELVKRYSPLAGVATMMSEAFAGEPMPPPFKKIIPEAPKDATPQEKEEIEQEKAKALAEKAAVEAKVKALNEQRAPLDTLFADALLLKFLVSSELKNAAIDFQPDPQSKLGIRDPANLFAVMMISEDAEKLRLEMLSQPETARRVNEAVAYLLGRIEADRKALPSMEVTPLVNQTIEKLLEEVKVELAKFTGTERLEVPSMQKS